MYTRQLVSRPTTSDPVLAAQIVPDLTVEVPTTANGGISADGLTYTFRIRPGASWNCPSGPRQITAQDVVLGIKRLFNPVCPTATPQYFTATIVGLAEFARGFAEVRHETKAIARYIDDHDVEGITARGQDTVVFRLVEPAIDFLDILTTAGASPAPREYLDYLPDGPEFRQQVVSSGPYRISSYRPGEYLRLDRNPAWRQETDEVRHAYVDEIVVLQGLTQEEAFRRVDQGEADLLWDCPPTPEQLHALDQSKDPRYHRFPRDMLEPYLVFNLVEQEAITRDVRRAIAYAVDKVAASAYWSAIVTPTPRLLPEMGSAGGERVLYDTKDRRGDPDRARALLAKAGFDPHRTFRLPAQDVPSRLSAAEAVRDSLAKAGIRTEVVPMPPDDYWRMLWDAGRARAGEWQLLLASWQPDWFGENARSFLAPLFDGSSFSEQSGTYGFNYGGYYNAEVSALIARGTGTSDRTKAHAYFREAAEQIMRDVAVVPIAYMDGFIFGSARLRGVAGYPVVHANIPELWIEEDEA